MDSAILSLLGAFLLSIIGLFGFIWSIREGLLAEYPMAGSVVFARGEIGMVDGSGYLIRIRHCGIGAKWRSSVYPRNRREGAPSV